MEQRRSTDVIEISWQGTRPWEWCVRCRGMIDLYQILMGASFRCMLEPIVVRASWFQSFRGCHTSFQNKKKKGDCHTEQRWEQAAWGEHVNWTHHFQFLLEYRWLLDSVLYTACGALSYLNWCSECSLGIVICIAHTPKSLICCFWTSIRRSLVQHMVWFPLFFPPTSNVVSILFFLALYFFWRIIVEYFFFERILYRKIIVPE